MSDELKPCPNPWCLSHEPESRHGPWLQVFNDTAPDIETNVIVRCSGCGVNAGTFTHSAEAASMLWNTRTDAITPQQAAQGLLRHKGDSDFKVQNVDVEPGDFWGSLEALSQPQGEE